jgi:starvation-inducible outer membrane lipoprotein
MFPPEVMKSAETNTFDFKAWAEQAHHPSQDNSIPRKVELGGQIMNIIRQPEGVVILAEELPIEAYPMYSPESIDRTGKYNFAIVFNGFAEPSMLQAGNRLIVVGTTAHASTEIVNGTATVLPHLMAQCLHIWNIVGMKFFDFAYEGNMGYYPPEEHSYCLLERTGPARNP